MIFMRAQYPWYGTAEAAADALLSGCHGNHPERTALTKTDAQAPRLLAPRGKEEPPEDQQPRRPIRPGGCLAAGPRDGGDP
jgi:hypothetical protein